MKRLWLSVWPWLAENFQSFILGCGCESKETNIRLPPTFCHRTKNFFFVVGQPVFFCFRPCLFLNRCASEYPFKFGCSLAPLDPHDIPIYLWKDGKATLAKLDDFKRTPLMTYYLARDYNGQNEPHFHLCNEKFDYAAWKVGKKMSQRPDFRGLGKD